MDDNPNAITYIFQHPTVHQMNTFVISHKTKNIILCKNILSDGTGWYGMVPVPVRFRKSCTGLTPVHGTIVQVL